MNKIGLYGKVYFVVLSIAVAMFMAAVDRSFVIDNDNYVRYFSDEGVLYEFLNRVTSVEGLGALPIFFSEEFVWQIYVTVVGSLFDANLAVVLTVIAINILIMYSIWISGAGLVGCLLWIVLPLCLPVVGFYQIRQGFAVSLFVFLCLIDFYPIVAAVIASMVHTTFVIPCVVVFFMGFDLLWKRKLYLFLVLSVIFLAVALMADGLFSEFAGRRGEIYAVTDGTASINFLIGVVFMILPSLYIVFLGGGCFGDFVVRMSIMHIGVSIWLFMAFVYFPVGTSRVGYYSQIFSIIPVGALLMRKTTSSFVVGFLYFLMVIVFVFGAVGGGSYYEILNARL